MKNIPYSDITNTNNIPKKIFVFIIAKISNPFESLTEKICVTAIVIPKKTPNNSKEKIPIPAVIIINQKEKPAVTANALNLGDESSILDRINESYKTTLC